MARVAKEPEVVSLKDVVDKVAAETKQPKTVVDQVVRETLDCITAVLKKQQTVRFIGFGSFEVRRRAGRTGVRPGTTEKIRIPAARVPVFKPGKQLKEAVQRRRRRR